MNELAPAPVPQEATPAKKKSSLSPVVAKAMEMPSYKERVQYVIANYPERKPLSLSVATLTKLMEGI